MRGNLIKAMCSFWVAVMAFNWLNRNWEKYSWCRRNKLNLACDFKSLSRNVLLQTVWLTPSPPPQFDRFFFFIWFIDSSVSIVTGMINTLIFVVRHYKKENKNKKSAYLHNSHEWFLWCSHDLHCFLTASSEHSFHSCQSHAVHQVTCQTKWYRLRGGEKFTLLKRHPYDYWQAKKISFARVRQETSDCKSNREC